MNTALWAAVVSGSGSALLVQLVLWARNRHADKAHADVSVSEAWQTIAVELRGDIADLRGRVEELETDLRHERAEAQRLRDEVKRYRDMIRSLLRYTLRLRDAVVEAGQSAPPFPQDVESAMTDPGLP